MACRCYCRSLASTIATHVRALIDDRADVAVLREHTNFTLAALLKDNVANQQAVVELQRRAVSTMTLS